MRNSVVVIFVLAAVLFVADSDSAVARSVSERAKRAADGVSELAAASYGEEASPTAEESSPQKRLHKRSSSLYYRQSQPEIDVSGLATALRNLEIQLTQITNQVAASLISYDPVQPLSPKRSNTPANNNPQAEKMASMAYDTVLALAKQLETLQGSLLPPEDYVVPEIVVEGKPAQVRQGGPVPLPADPGYLPEITIPITPVNLPYNPSHLPYNPAALPYPTYPIPLPYDPENTQGVKPKPLPATKPKPDGSRPGGDSSSKPYAPDGTSDSTEDDDTDQTDNGQEPTKIVYESRMDDNPYNLIPAVLHLRMKKP